MNKLSKIQRLSAAMAIFCLVLLIALPICMALFWLNFDKNISGLPAAQPSIFLSEQYIQAYQVVLAAAISMVALLVPLYGIWHLRKLFGLFRTGIFFSENAVRHMYVFGLTLFIGALLKPLLGAVLSVVLTIENPPGLKSLAIQFGSNELFQILMAGTLTAITWILREGQKLAAENAEFI